MSSGPVEGMNNNSKAVMRKAYLRISQLPAVEAAVYHTLGKLPDPEFAHRFT